MLEKIKKYSKSIYIPFIVLGIVIAILHFQITKIYDDLIFSAVLDDGTKIFEYLSSRYNGWTSRLVIEFFLVVLSNENTSLVIWKIIDILMFELLAYSTYKIFIKDVKDNNKKLCLTWILILAILAFPYTLLCEAGYIATTTNYLWVLTFRNVHIYIN